MSQAIELADAITAAINSHDFSLTFTAERVKDWKPNIRLADAAAELKVMVVPSGRTAVRDTRDMRRIDFVTDVAIVRGVSQEEINDEELDALMTLAEEIDRYLYVSPTLEGHSYESAELIYPDEQLIQSFAFVAIVRVTHKASFNVINNV